MCSKTLVHVPFTFMAVQSKKRSLGLPRSRLFFQCFFFFSSCCGHVEMHFTVVCLPAWSWPGQIGLGRHVSWPCPQSCQFIPTNGHRMCVPLCLPFAALVCVSVCVCVSACVAKCISHFAITTSWHLATLKACLKSSYLVLGYNVSLLGLWRDWLSVLC